MQTHSDTMAALSVGTLVETLTREVSDLLARLDHREVASDLQSAKDAEGRLKALLRALPLALKSKLKQGDDPSALQMLALSMGVLEKAFVDSIEGNRLNKILTLLIPKMYNVLKEAEKSKGLPIPSKPEIASLVEGFYKNVSQGTR